MNHSFNKKFFDSMVKVVHVFLKWSVRALFVLLGILVVGFFVTMFIPVSSFDFDLQNLEHINVNVMNIMYDLSNVGLSGVVNIKWILVLGIFVAIGHLAFYQFLQILLCKLMKNIKEGSPFNSTSAGYLRVMGIGFLVASAVMPFINGLLFVAIMNKFDIYEATINFSIDFQYLFIGVLILILGYTFEYGAYLQEEHNMTV